MFSAIKRFLLYIDLIVNHGISPSTILHNKPRLNSTNFHKPDEDKDKHGMGPC